MAIYMTRWFDRWVWKQDISANSLCKAVREILKEVYCDAQEKIGNS